jgi:hypothetical protein
MAMDCCRDEKRCFFEILGSWQILSRRRRNLPGIPEAAQRTEGREWLQKVVLGLAAKYLPHGDLP